MSKFFLENLYKNNYIANINRI